MPYIYSTWTSSCRWRHLWTLRNSVDLDNRLIINVLIQSCILKNSFWVRYTGNGWFILIHNISKTTELTESTASVERMLIKLMSSNLNYSLGSLYDSQSRSNVLVIAAYSLLEHSTSLQSWPLKAQKRHIEKI